MAMRFWNHWGLFAVVGLAACGSRGGVDGIEPRPRPTVIDTSSSFATTGSEPILRAAMEYPPPLADDAVEIPVSLTASDGTGLALSSLSARAVVDGPLAFTELTLQFKNPKDRIIEGRFSITLPQDAAISRLAMKIDGGWQEAEVVEKMAARQAYEDFLHRRQDPALMEKEAGNAFRARIFPIPANGVKDIIISYSHELSGAESEYVLPLRGLPEVANLSVEALVATPNREMERVTLNEKGWVPDRDFRVAPKRAVAGLASGDFVMVRARPALSADAAPIADLLILFDTSASRALGFAREVKRLGALVEALAAANPNAKLAVAAYDQTVSEVFDGPVSGFGAKQLDSILARRPLGASDLGAALAWARGRTTGRVIVVTDGIATAGATERNELRALATDIGARRIDAVVTGGIRDEAAMAEIARGTSKVDGTILDGGLGTAELARRISSETVSGVDVKVAGAAWVWPSRLDGVQPGDEFLIYAFVPKRKGAAIDLTLGDKTTSVKLESTHEPLIRRAAVKAEIAHLEHTQSSAEAKQRAALQVQIVELSTRERVLSDHTALLVLETDEDYARFNIDRRALADILTVGKRGVEVMHRDRPVVVVRPERLVNDDGEPDPGSVGKTEEFKKTLRKADEAGDMPATKTPDGVRDPRKKIEITAGFAKPKPAMEPSGPPPPDNDHDAVMDEQDSGDDDERTGSDSVGGEGQGRAGDRIQAEQAPSRQSDSPSESEQTLAELETSPPAHTGEMAKIQKALSKGELDKAVVAALSWRSEEPGDVMALIALGESLELRGNFTLAARAYGSIIDLFPSRADLRRFAAARLQRLEQSGIGLAVDSLENAVAQRPDHMTGHRLLGYARVRKGDWKGAFAAIEAGLNASYPDGRFNGGKRILAEDLGIVAAGWIAAKPGVRANVVKRLTAAGARLATRPSLRFVLNWETDANDVDFHILDGQGGHASYREKELRSGGVLFEDVTNGYGPECFRIDGKPDAFPYRFLIHYYSRGPMGYGMGQVEVLQHDGKGTVRMTERPFVVMNDGAWIELGQVKAPLR